MEEIGIPNKINKNRPGKKRRELERLFISQKRKKEKKKRKELEILLNHVQPKPIHSIIQGIRCYIFFFFFFDEQEKMLHYFVFFV